MIRPDPDPNEPSLSWPAWGPALAAALLIVVIGGMTTYLALKFGRVTAQIGDMIVFVPTQGDGDTWQLQVGTNLGGGTRSIRWPLCFRSETRCPRPVAA